jgi:translation elongation factor EF-4
MHGAMALLWSSASGQSQKESERKMRQYGKVDIPLGAFIAALKVDV